MKVNKIINYVLVGLITLLCFYISIEIVVALKNEMPVSLFSYSVSYVPTDSMEGEILVGDYVLFKKTDFKEIDKNDIIVYKSKTGEMAGNFIIHRVIEEHDDYFITQGDNNPIPDDEHVTSDMVVGKYVKVLGFMRGLAKSKSTLTIIVFVIVLLCFGCQLFTAYLKKKKEELKQNNEKEKQELLEQLKKEILEEELAKIKSSKK